jgi:cysteine-rich repeat protein
MRVGYRDAPFGYIRTSAYTYESACSGGAIFGLLKDDAAGGHALAGFGCMLPECGDGRVEGDEACDDGNTEGGDFCSADCSEILPGCGDGIVSGDEDCDDGDFNDTNLCSNACTLNDLDCEVISFVSDGYCDSENNTGGCGWDGGDCCPSTCVDTPSYTCSDSVSSCQDPSACENIGGCP